MKKLMILAVSTLIGSCLLAQNREIINSINQSGAIGTDIIWITTDEWVSSFTDKMEKLNKKDLQYVVDLTEKEAARLDEILQVRSDIIKNETDPAKQVKKLQRYFSDLDKAAECFSQAEKLRTRALKVHDAAASYLNMVHSDMPEENLTSFKWFIKDSFGDTKKVTLARNDDGKAEITYDDTEKAIVDDSIFGKVDNMIREGQLYDLAKSYEPFDLPLDIVVWNWSITMVFGDKEIYSSGIGEDPDHSETIETILTFLRKTFLEANAK